MSWNPENNMDNVELGLKAAHAALLELLHEVPLTSVQRERFVQGLTKINQAQERATLIKNQMSWMTGRGKTP